MKINGKPDGGGGGGVITGLSVTSNGIYTAGGGVDGYSPVNVDVEFVTEALSVSENGTFNPGTGVDGFSTVTVSVPGIEPSGTMNIINNGTYDVTTYASVAVSVGGKDYRYKTGTFVGLDDLGWDVDSIGYATTNLQHYTWENSAYTVTSENKALYGVINASNKNNYKNNKDMKFVPVFDTSSVTNWEYFFNEFKNIEALPVLDMTGVTGDLSLDYLFQFCSSLKIAPEMNISGTLKSIASMFRSCINLKVVPKFDTSNVTEWAYMFYYCSSLTDVPDFDMSSATDLYAMFQNCESLKNVPLFNTGNVTNFEQMFNQCINLETIPAFDTSNGIYFTGMFGGCRLLSNIPALDTSNGTNMDQMFNGVGGYISDVYINGIDFSSLTAAPNSFFGWDNQNDKVKRLIVNGKIDFDCSSTTGFIQSLQNIDYASVKSILQAMYRTTNNDSKTMVFGNIVFIDSQSELTQLISDCSTKGWTVTGLTLYTSAVGINYTTYDNNSISPNVTTAFGTANYLTTTYENGVGTWWFDASVTELGDDVFSWLSTLSTITIPSSVTSIGDRAFIMSGLSIIDIPVNVASIGSQAYQSIPATVVVFESLTPPTMYNSDVYYVFNTSNIVEVRVPQAALSTYQNDSAFSAFSSIIVGY